MLNGVAVTDGQRVIVSPGLGVADQEGAVFVLSHQQFLLGLDSFDLAEVPSGNNKFKMFSVTALQRINNPYLIKLTLFDPGLVS